MSVSYGPPRLVSDSIVFFADAGNYRSGVSASEWRDLISGENATGFSNITYTRDRGRSYYEFINGLSKITFDDYVVARNIFDGGGTVEGWIYADGPGGASLGRWINKRNTAENDGWICLVGPGIGGTVDLRFLYIFSGGNGDWVLSDAMTTGAWHHVVITYNADSTSNVPIIYLDGAALGTPTTTAPIGTRTDDTNGDIVIGNADNNIRAWDGRIGMCVLHNRILTADEVKQNFEATRGRFGL